PALTVDGPGEQPAAGVDALLALGAAAPAVACLQRELIAEVVAGACARLGRPVDPAEVGEPAKGGLVVLHLAGDGAPPRLVDWERLPPVG
ncbi:MAG: hypothetical protein ACRDWY_13680, partial [Actinomycetes bacterium]